MFDSFVASGGSPRAAFAAALLLTLSPPLLIFSILFFTELVSALVCLAVFRRLTLDAQGSTWRWLVTGAATGFLFLLHAKNIGLVIPLFAIALLHLRRRSAWRQAAVFAAGVVALVLLRTAINYHFWGGWLTGPHARLSASADSASILTLPFTRLAGFLIDQEYGLLIYAPVYVLATTGFIALLRQHRELALRIFLVAGFYVLLLLLPVTNVHGWRGGWNPPGRFLTPVLPLVGVAVFSGLRTGRLPVVATICAAQIVIDGYIWQHPKILWNDGDGRAAFCERLGEEVCRSLPTITPRE
jgi:hypothetical protein